MVWDLPIVDLPIVDLPTVDLPTVDLPVDFVCSNLLDRRPELDSTLLNMPIPNASQNNRTMVLSYRDVRRAVGLSGLLLPVALGLGGYIVGVPIQDNISSYYHTAMRDVFVGTMSAMGVFLLCYRGLDWVENWTANIGCAAALCIALCPLDANSDPLFQKSIVGYLHTFSGGVFFLTLAFYSLVHFPRSGNEIEEPHLWERRLIYRTSGIVILLSMVAMGSYMILIPFAWKSFLNQWNFLFWMESIAVWAFAAAWLTKGRAIFAEIGVELLSIPTRILKRHSD